MKRFFDILFSFFGIIFLLPVIFFISIAIVADSKGGIFYKQVRVGKNGKDFKLLKFRSMTSGSDKKGLLTVGNNDSRITKVGAFIRKFKLDEIPQLFNVFKGEMSFVGPRPEVRKYVDLYTQVQAKILSVLPGITDYASIEYSDENKLLALSSEPEKLYIEKIMPDKILLNMKYINSPTIKEYFKIIFLTVFKIFGFEPTNNSK